MVSAVILAAGKSERMGRPKLALKLGERSLVGCVVESALLSRAGEVIVVLGKDLDELHSEVKTMASSSGKGVRVVFSENPEQGMSFSMRLGIAAVSEKADGVLFLLGDQPLVRPEHIDAIISRFEKGDVLIVHALYNGKRGNPVLFSASLLGELRAVRGDKGGRDVLAAHESQAAGVELPVWVGQDVDCWDDYVQLLASCSYGSETNR